MTPIFLSQLPLTFSAHEEASFLNYYAGRNAQVVEHLKKVIDQKLTENSYICSAQGLGRSHLLHAACKHAENQGISAIYIPFLQYKNWTPDALIEFESISLICIDDLQAIAGNALWEEAFFYLYNRVHTMGGRFIITANGLPKTINITLPDLVSRLTWGMIYQLQGLQDHEKIQMLIMRAERRGMMLSEEVARYILTHCPRHMSTLMTALDVLDKASLAAQRRLTIPFIKDVLQI